MSAATGGLGFDAAALTVDRCCETVGLDVRTEVAKLQQIMGVCPQEDLLWPELTAREHLALYARFKGIAEAEIEQHCTDILTSVGLLADSDNRVSTFSGGMKRRLSVGVASIASPQIMFLDEPSTGMDPLSKRRVWTMIEQLKAGRVMLLTTHSMEEYGQDHNSLRIVNVLTL